MNAYISFIKSVITRILIML